MSATKPSREVYARVVLQALANFRRNRVLRLELAAAQQVQVRKLHPQPLPGGGQFPDALVAHDPAD